ncbi:hypothetical protein ATER59S_00107 [Aquamicrobium terrae]
MVQIIKGLVVTLMVGAVGVVFFAIAYAGVHWYETGSFALIQDLDQDPFATLRRAYADVAIVGRFQQALYAAGLALIGMMVLAVMTVLMTRKASNDAKFLSLADVNRAGLTKRGGVFIGRAGGSLVNVIGAFTQRGSNKKRFTKPKLVGGKKLWVDGDDVGGFVVGPPRSGKGAALIIPNALLWPDSLVVLDMRGETYQATAGYRSTFSKVIRFSPADEKGETECYNPLDFISLDTDQRDIDIRNIAAALFPRPTTGETYWVDDGRMLFAGVISYVMETPRLEDSQRTLRQALRIMNGAERPFLEWIQALRDEEARELSDYTLQMLASYADMSDKQFSGLFGSVRTGLNPFMNERLLRATDKSTFDIRNLKREKVSLYLDFRIEQIRSIGPLFNVLITQLMNYMAKEVPGPGEHRVLILLDEFQNLGKLENVMEAATILGGYGVPTWFFVQSLKSVDTIYREEGRKTLVNSARVQVFFGAQDAEDLKYISDTLGERTEVQKDISKTQATMFDMHHARTVHVKEVRRPLMRPDEIRTMSRNKCIILPRGSHAIFGTRNFYFADAELSKRAWMPIPAFKAAAAKVDTEPDAGRKAAPKPSAGFGDMLVPPRFARASEAAPASTRPRGAVFAAKAGMRPPPPAHPVTVTTSIAATPKPSTSRPPLPRNKPDLAAITRAAGRNQEVSTEAQAKIAEAISRVAKVAAKAANKSEADAGLRDLETALQGVD